MSNNLKFDFDKPLKGASPTSENENIVIQCKFCETRYAIPSESMRSSDAPKFHCFSCDNIFEVEFQEAVVESRPEIKPETKVSSGMSQGFFEEPARISKPDSSFGFNSSLKVTSDNPLATVRSKKQAVQESEKLSFAINNQAPDLSVRNIDSGSPRKSFVFAEFQKSLTSSAKEKVASGIIPNAWKAEASGVKVKDLVSKFSFPKIDPKKFTVGVPKMSFPKMAMPTFSIKENLPVIRRSRLGLLTKLSFVLIPVAAVLFLLYLLTSIILTSPQSFAGYFGLATKSSQVFPIPGVGVKSLDLKLVKLDNGEDLKLLSGEFYNNSSKLIKNPIIEGVLFDTKGQVLARSFHTLDKDLTDVQYQALDLKTLTELPKSKEKDKFTLLPNQKQRFTFALSADSTVRPSYFAGRVYSIS